MRESIEERESQFKTALKIWKNTDDPNIAKENWDIMFNRVYDACINIGKTKCIGLRVTNLEDKCLDATLKIMEKIKEGVEPEKLSSYCYLWTIGQIWSVKERRWDQALDYDDFTNYAYIEDEDGSISMCEAQY